MTDFILYWDDSITIITPVTALAKEWVGEHIADDAQTFGDGVVVERRYFTDIVVGIQHDGLTVAPAKAA
jgi:hypothetical protein